MPLTVSPPPFAGRLMPSEHRARIVTRMRSSSIGRWLLTACAVVGAVAVMMAAALVWLLASSPELAASTMVAHPDGKLLAIIADLAGELCRAILRFLS